MLMVEFADRFQYSFNIFDQSLPLCQKNSTQKKKSSLQQRVQDMKVLDSGGSCRDVMLKFECGKLLFSRIMIFLLSLHMCMYAHTLNCVLFNFFIFVISAWTKHIYLKTLYKSVVSVWWCSNVMWASKTGPCHAGTHIARPNSVPSW